MNKIIKIIAIALVACCLLALLSSFPSFDELNSEIKERFENKNDSVFEKYEESVFYLTSGDKMNSYETVSDIPDDLRGFFVKDDLICFAIKVTGSDDRFVNISEDDLTYGGYEYCYYVTYDMVTFINYSDTFTATINGDALIVYLVKDNIEENRIVDFNDKLIANQPINITFADPVSPEGPGAE